MRSAVRQLTFFAILLLAPLRAVAQITPPQPPSEETHTRIRIRSLRINPTVALSNVGSDSNVFNSVDNPQPDFTMTVSPLLDAWARVGRARVAARGKTDLVYFNKFASERSVDGGVGVRVELPVNRVMPWGETGTFSGRQRAGYELDLRSRRTQVNVGLGVDVRVAPKTTVGAGFSKATTRWSGDATFLGNSLSAGLDRTSNAATLTYRQELTVLTTLAMEATAATERFDVLRERDTDAVSIVAGFDLKTRALISGQVRVGAKKIDPVGGAFAPFKGAVAKASVGYSIGGATRLNIEVSRDTAFSFDLLYPFFLQTGVSGTITQRIYNSWDVQGRIGRQSLAYKPLRGSSELLTNRVDSVDERGGGVGYRLNPSTRIGLNLDWAKRSSLIQTRDYRALRIGAALTYVG